RLIFAEIALKFGIERDVALIVAEEIELNLVRAGARHVEVVERIAVGRNRRRIAYAVGVLPKRRFGRDEASQRVPVCLRRFAPIGPNGVPAVAQALLIG